MEFVCEECAAKHAIDDELARRSGVGLCPECGFRYSIVGSLLVENHEDWIVVKANGSRVVARSLADVQLMLATGALDVLDLLEVPGAGTHRLGDIEGLRSFGPDRAGQVASRDTPPYGAGRLEDDNEGSIVAGSTASWRLSSTPLFRETLRPVSDGSPQELVSPALVQSTTKRPSSAPSAGTSRPVELPSPGESVAPSGAPGESQEMRTNSPLVPLGSASSNGPRSPTRRARADIPQAGRRGWVIAGALAAVAVLGSLGVSRLVAEPRRDRAVADELLRGGEAALDCDQVAVAKEQFDKASALVPVSGRLLQDAARVANTQADEEWLRRRLVSGEARDELRRTEQSLLGLSVRATKLSLQAMSESPNDPLARALAVDALRIFGDLERARVLADGLPSTAVDGDFAYVRAMLMLAEDGPVRGEAIDLLRHAVLGTSGRSKARSALVYALARRGEGTALESDRMSNLTQAAPLAEMLRAYATRTAPSSAVEGPRPNADAGPRDGGASPGATVAAASPSRALEARSNGGGSSGPAAVLRRAEVELRAGRLERGRQLYLRLLDGSSGLGVEAHLGLAKVARAEGDLEAARHHFEAAEQLAPHTAQAQLLLADDEWSCGEIASASQRYRQIVDTFTRIEVPLRARERAARSPPAQSDDR